jgi:cytoskeleton protein RodZ
VRLDIRVVEHPSWLRVIADGKTVFEATLQPGAELNWEAERSIVLRTGNAGGVLVTFNDRPLGLMGRLGEVKEVRFEPGLNLRSLQ